MRSWFVLFVGLVVAGGSAVIGQDGILDTVAGTGESVSSGDGGMATEASFSQILSIATRTSDGSQFVADTAANVIRRIDGDGVITTFCGQNGDPGYTGDGGPADEARLSAPYDVAFDGDENLYIAEAGNNVVRKVDAATGAISSFAGTGTPGYSGPADTATEVQLNLPAGLAVDSDGNVYISDQHNGLVRKVDSDGNLTTVAGDFEQKGQSTGDGGPATQAGLNGPGGLAIGSDGSLYIAEVFGHRVRKVATDGTITTFAGTGVAGYSGDGSAAADATLHFDDGEGYPNKLEMASDGSLLIADPFNHAIRRVDPSCCIETFAGSGSAGYDGDGEWAFKGKLNAPYDIACQPSGDFTIADTDNFRLRQVNVGLEVPAGAGATASLGEEVTVTFDGVNTGVVIEIDVNDSNDPAVPDNLQVDGKRFDFNITAGTYVGTITLRIKYDSTGKTLEQELALELLHHNGSEWVSVKVGQDTDADVIIGEVESLSPFQFVSPRTSTPLVNFRRGETNQDGTYDISDGVFTLLHLFAGRSTECPDALDANDDGGLNLTDAVYLLNWLFISGAPIPPPGPAEAGLDQTADELGCTSYHG